MVLTAGFPGATLVRNPPIVLSASAGASLGIEADGRIVYCSDSDGVKLALRVIDDRTFFALADCDIQIRLLGSGLNAASARIVACHAPGAALPFSILVLPPEGGCGSHFIPLDVHALAPARPDGALRGLVVTAGTEDFWVASEHEHITVRVGSLGGVAFVAPLHELATSETASGHGWHVAMLHPHADVRVITVEELVEVVPQRLLPTPPPSPPITTSAASRPPPLALPSFTEALGAPVYMHSSPLSATVSTSTEGSASVSPRSTTRVRPPTPYPITRSRAEADELAVMRVHSIYPLSSYVRTLFAMFAWIWRVIFQRFAFLWLGAAVVQAPDTGTECDYRVSSPHNSETDAQVNQLMNDDEEDAGGGAVPGGAKPPQPSTPTLCDESLAKSVAHPEPKTSPKDSKTMKKRAALQIHLPSRSGRIDILVRAPETTLLAADHLEFILNGKILPESQSIAKQHGYELVQLNVSAGDVNMLTVTLV